MHDDEIQIPEQVVKSLLKIQFPQYAHLPIKAVFPNGTDNKIFQLGENMSIRLPRTPAAATRHKKEMYILQELEEKLTLTIPKIVKRGKSCSLFPHPWVITTWIDGTVASSTKKIDATIALADFYHAMHTIPITTAPKTKRGKSLHAAKKEVEKALPLLKDEFDIKKLHIMWEKALQVKEWNKAPVWIHGDLHPGNMIIKSEKLIGIIDFGLAGIGDPAADLMCAWTYLSKKSRNKFRSLVGVDEDTWQRGCGWALFLGIVAYPYYKNTDPSLATIAKNTLHELLQENQ